MWCLLTQFIGTIPTNPLENGFLLRKHHRKQANSQVDRMLSADNLGMAFAKVSRADWCVWMQCTPCITSLRTWFNCQDEVFRKRRRKPLAEWRTVKVWCLRAILPQNGAGKLPLCLLPSCSTQTERVQFFSFFYGDGGWVKYIFTLDSLSRVCVYVW